jgi:hypothetical protein
MCFREQQIRAAFLQINHLRLLWLRRPDQLADFVNQLLPVSQCRLLLLSVLGLLHSELEPLPFPLKRREPAAVWGRLIVLPQLFGQLGSTFFLFHSLPSFNLTLAYDGRVGQFGHPDRAWASPRCGSSPPTKARRSSSRAPSLWLIVKHI